MEKKVLKIVKQISSFLAVRTPFSCLYNGPPISIFAVRVHAHQWGLDFFSYKIVFIVYFLARVNSLYRVRNEEISQIAKGDPQWPQSFYPLSSPVTVEKGDYIVGQCVYDNDGDQTIQVG